jgi:hypothetical protein
VIDPEEVSLLKRPHLSMSLLIALFTFDDTEEGVRIEDSGQVSLQVGATRRDH